MARAPNQMADPATVVIDNGTGYTKMGYAGNMEPSYLIPSVIAKSVPKVGKTVAICSAYEPWAISRVLTKSFSHVRSKEELARKTSLATLSWTSTSERRRNLSKSHTM